MANQTIGVNLKFSADVSAAKRAMAELQGSLAQIHNAAVTSANPGIRYAKDLNQASQAAAQLRIQLQNAFNQDTGKLNLTKFNMEMKQAGMSVEKYRAALTSIGPQGQQAFTQLAHSVAMAETNTINLSAGIQRLGTTFMNTLRYQLSSTVIMGFVQGISEAVTYVKDLNASLNDIRIVTNYGVDEMKEFANYANKAAKALSTTTNEYAKASLIYFQQGLTDEEVQKRTDLTIKMANVTGQAVGEVSDQLTSVWNNFDNGTKSLEHYVDVMVALGAATASSSEEISEGLNKFAAVAETVGLSYEYAAAALATVTATTRQSADIVGTAFKTLFARIQDLELGKELDDGTTLGQYSQALAAVGINIKDVNGEVKDMNSILDEMGVKWNTLSKDSQIALAQNVAGVRQYTQLIALMDNWDFFKQNLETANASTGSLQEQADIYAESWEAASQRVTASLEIIYSKLLNDEFFIDATNLLADFIGLVENLIDGLGGMPGVLALVGVALTRVFSTQMAQGINNMAHNIRSMTKAGKAENAKMQQDFANAAAKEYGTTGASGQQGVIAKEEARLQEIYIRNKGKMSELEKQVLETRMAELKIQKQQVNSEIEQTKTLEKQVQVQKRISQNIMSSRTALKRREGFDDERIEQAERSGNRYLGTRWVPGQKDTSGYQRGFMYMTEQESNRAFADLKYSTSAQQINTALDIQGEDTFKPLFEGTTASYDQQSKAIEELQSRLKALGVTKDTVDAQMKDEVGDELSSKYQNLAAATDAAQQAIEEYNAAVARGDSNQDKYKQAIDEAVAAVRKEEQALQGAANSMRKESQEAITLAGGTDEATQATIDLGVASGQNKIKIMELGQQYDKTGKNAEKSAIRILDFGTAMQQSAMMISTLTMVVTSLIGLFKTLSDEEIDTSEKITTVLTTLGFMLPMVIGLFNDQTKSLFLTAGAALAAAGGQTTAGEAAKISGFKALKASAMWKGLGITLAKFAIYAVAIGAVVLAVTALAKAADDARNSVENFAASAAQGARDAAEAYGEATTAFNELKQSIESYENALTGLQKLTKGTNEYKQALFDANEQALALVQSHTGLKYYIDSNGLIVFDEGELDRIEEEAQQKKADAYSAKLSADRGAREAAIENQKVSLGRKLKGEDNEWNDEDDAAVLTGASVGTASAAVAGFAGAKIGAALGTALAPGVGTAIGAGIGVVLGGITGLITGAIEASKNDATSQEKEAMDALYEAYKEQGSAALTEDGIRAALNNIGIDDENLIKSLAANKDSTEDLMKAMEANTAAIEAETLMAATQQAHALDPTLQYRDSEVQNAVTKALARARTAAEETAIVDSNSYRDKKLFGAYYSHTDEGKKDFEAYLREQGLGDQVNAIYEDSNFSKDYIEYEYIDENGDTQEKKLTYAQLAAWKTAKNIDAVSNDSYDNIIKAINSAQEFFGDGSEGLLSIIGGQNLISLSEKELKDFKSAFDTGKYDEYITNNWKALGYESEKAFTKAIAEGIANWDYETAFGQFSKQLNAEIDGILSAGAEETEYTVGALENYTEALAKNNAALHDNTDAWSNLEKKKMAAQAAVANTKFIKGVDALNEVLEDTLDVLRDWNEASLDTWEAADKIQTALEDVFGLRVSADFIKNNLEDIQALADGSTENLEELSRAAALDFALNIDTLSEEDKTNFAHILNEFADIAANNEIVIGTDINSEEYISQLNEMLSAGRITAEQVQQAFGALGYSPDVKFKTITQTTKTTHRIFDNPEKPKEFKTIVSETDSEVQIPYIAGEGTYQAPAKDGSDSGQENGSGITKVRDIGSIGASLSDTKSEKEKQLKSLGRYHELNEILGDITRTTNAYSEAKSRAWGADKVAYIDKEAASIADELYYQQQLNAAVEDYLLKDRAKATSFGAIFDEQGRISNWTEVLSGLPETRRKEAQEAFDQYEETLNQYEEGRQKIIELNHQIKDLSLEKIEYQIEINVQVNDDQIKYLEYLLKKLDDPVDDAVDSIQNIGKQMQENLDNLKTYQQGIRDVLGESFSKSEIDTILDPNANEETLTKLLKTHNLTSQQIEDLRNYRDELMATEENLDELYSRVGEKVNEAFEAQNEEIEKTIDKFEFLTSVLDTYQNVIDLVGKTTLGLSTEAMRSLSRATVETAKAQLQATKTQLEINEANLESAKKAREAAEAREDEKAVEQWDKTIETISSKVEELKGELNSQWTNALEASAQDFENAMTSIVETFEEAMTGVYGSYEKMSEVFNQQKEINDRYLDDYAKIYELSKLNRDINKSIDDADSVKAKRTYKELQEEINALQKSGAELTEHDVEYLRKKYELRQAEIALEEAQNAKSQVRMTRDAEGNWSYIYTADSNKVEEAQQSYEDKLYQLQKLEQDYIEQMQDNVIKSEQEMLQAIQEIDRTKFASEKAYQDEVMRITEYYTGQRQFYLNQLNTALGNSKTVYEEDWKAYSEKTGYQISADKDWADKFEETRYSITTGFTSIDEAHTVFAKNTKTLVADMTTAYSTWREDVNDVFELAGKDFETFGTNLGSTVDNIINDEETGLTALNDSLSDIAKNNPFDDIVTNANTSYETYKNKIKEYIGQNDALIKSLNNLLELKTKVENTEDLGGGTPPNPNVSVDRDIWGDDGTWHGEEAMEMSYFDVLRMLAKGRNIMGQYSHNGDTITDESIKELFQAHPELEDLYKEYESGWYDTSRKGANPPETPPQTPPETPPKSDESRIGGYAMDAKFSFLGEGVAYRLDDSNGEISVSGMYSGINDSFGDNYWNALGGSATITARKRGINQSGEATYFYQHPYKTDLWIDEKDLETSSPWLGWLGGSTRFSGFGGTLNRTTVMAYDTGGYTGAWGSEGRIAMLHQKELVLNSDDTANFLSAINIVRDIARAVDLRAAAQQSALSMMSATSIAPTTQTLQQEVTIHAEFPNATQRTEIEAAFDTLLNRASQFANRKI